MKKTIVYTFALALIGSTVPGLGLLIGDTFLEKLQSHTSTDTSKDWRYAKLAYRSAQLSPFFKATASQKSALVDQLLSETMYKLVLTGANQNSKRSQPIGPKQHLSFLAARTDNQSNLAFSLAQAYIRYGKADQLEDALLEIESDERVTPFAMATALLTGDEDYLETFAAEAAAFPLGYYFFTNTLPPRNDTSLAQLITAHKTPEKTDWLAIYGSVDEIYKPLIAEGYARTDSPQPDVLQTMLQDAGDEWICAKLAASVPLQNQLLVSEAITQLKAQERFYTYTQLSTSAYCHPEVFTAAKTDNQEEGQWLALFAAHAYLAQFKMDQAQSLLYLVVPPTEQERNQPSQIEPPPTTPENIQQNPPQNGNEQFQQPPPSQPPGQQIQPAPAPAPEPKEITSNDAPKPLAVAQLTAPQKILHLYLHCLLNEMEGNTNKMEYYAQQGQLLDKDLFSLVLAKAHLLRAQKQGAAEDLAASNATNLSTNLAALHNDLTATVLRTQGETDSTEINGKKVLFNVWENNAEFREWYTNHAAAVLQSPTASTVLLSILINSSRGQQEGEVLTDFFWCNEITPNNVAMYTHLKYMYFSLQPTPELTNKKEEFIKAKSWLGKLPFPQLLRIESTAFTLTLETDS